LAHRVFAHHKKIHYLCTHSLRICLEGTASPLFVSMDLKEKIKDLAEKSLATPTHFVVEVVVSKHKPWKFTVIVDGDQGITIDDCAVVSRALNESLEMEISDPYTLEVSTPGLDHPLKLKRQYKKNIGRGVKVVRKDKTIVNGTLKQAEEEKIAVENESGSGKKTEVKIIEISFTEIEKAFVTVSFK
jgi:ribosome maturation factor RimP